MMRRDGGFTLIEIVVAVAIMSLLATLAGVTLMGAQSRVSLEDVAERVVAYDQGARTYAARFGRAVTLRFGDHEVTQSAGEEEEADERRAPLVLSSAFTLRVIGLPEGAEGLAISSAGRSRSYGVVVTGPGDADAEACVVMAGLTGEAWVVDRADAAEALLHELAGTDAD